MKFRGLVEDVDLEDETVVQNFMKAGFGSGLDEETLNDIKDEKKDNNAATLSKESIDAIDDDDNDVIHATKKCG